MKYIDINQLKFGFKALTFMLALIAFGYLAVPFVTNGINSFANQFNTNFVSTEKLQS